MPLFRDLIQRFIERGPFAKSELALLTAFVGFTMAGAAVLTAQSLFPQLFYGEPTFNADERHALNPAQEAAEETPVRSTETTAETSGGETSEEGMSAPLNLNAAEAAELQQLPGIGAVLAQRIVSWRNKQGPFETLEDLLKVEGIGEKRLEQLREAARIGQALE